VSGLAAGTCTIAADQAGSANYNAASQATQSIAVASNTTLPPTGDLNGNGTVDIADALRALQLAVGIVTPTAVDLGRGDVAPLGGNGKPAPNGAIDIADAVLILEKAVGVLNW
jgi:hypothetical protein